MAFADINGITVHYELLGEPTAKKLIVFSNALGTDFRIWLPVFDELDDDISFLLYDSRGHGLTGTGKTPFAMGDLVDDLIGLVEHLGIQRATFCGLSVGGIIAQGVWAKRPDLVKKLILCNTAPKVGSDDLWNTRIGAIRKGGIAGLVDSIMERWFTADFREERTTDLAGYGTMLERQPVEGYIATCAAIRDADYAESTKTIDVPTLCVAGDQDGSTPPELVRDLAGLIEGSKFEIIEDCGHIPCIEQPEQLAALIQAFMKKG